MVKMQKTIQFTALFAVLLPLFGNIEVAGQKLVRCEKPGEEFRSCGCEGTCHDPTPNCMSCRPGCFCMRGLVRNPSTSYCSSVSQCPGLFHVQESPSKAHRKTCPKDEVYKLCHQFHRTCEIRYPVWTQRCRKGCFCKRGLLKNNLGVCVKIDDCQKFPEFPMGNIGRLEVQGLCGTNQVYKLCGCEKSCTNREPSCSGSCKKGCFCKSGFVMGPRGNCISIERCPQSPMGNIGRLEVQGLCGTNQVYKLCGCEKSCIEREPSCSGSCKKGCFCKSGFVMGPRGNCISIESCPQLPWLGGAQPRLEAIEAQGFCGTNQVYKLCGCESTCVSRERSCTGSCVKGCFCKSGFVMGPKRNCIPIESCPQLPWNAGGTEPRLLCGENQEYKVCACERSCGDPEPTCSGTCSKGCVCKEGFVRGSNGSCTSVDTCRQFTTAVSLMGHHELTVEDCGPDEEYLSCGWCEPTCSSLHPQCPVGVCTTGCLCRPPLVRHHSGLCVEPKQCLPQRCSKPNEIFRCSFGCEKKCPGMLGCARSRSCVLGCHCQTGFVYSLRGCVRPEEC